MRTTPRNRGGGSLRSRAPRFRGDPGCDLLDQVLGDLAQEGAALEALVAPLDDAGWRTPTPAAGWDIATQVAHLAWTDEVAVFAATDKVGWDEVVLQAIADPEGFVDTAALAGAKASPAEILERWRAARARAAGRRCGPTRRARRCRGSGRR